MSESRLREIADQWIEALGGPIYHIAGSLSGSGHLPVEGSDLDIWIAIESDIGLARFPGIKHIVEHDGNFYRLLTIDGYVVDVNFRPANEINTSLVAPVYSPLSEEEGRQLAARLAVVVAAVPSIFRRKEFESALFQLDLLRIELVKLMYMNDQRVYAQQYKHFSEIFNDEQLSHILLTYPESTETWYHLRSAYQRMIENIADELRHLAGLEASAEFDTYLLVMRRVGASL